MSFGKKSAICTILDIQKVRTQLIFVCQTSHSVAKGHWIVYVEENNITTENTLLHSQQILSQEKVERNIFENIFSFFKDGYSLCNLVVLGITGYIFQFI